MKYAISSEFESLIDAKRLEVLNRHSSSIYGLDSNLNISYLNPAWFDFAKDNGSDKFIEDKWSLGKSIFNCIPKVLEPFYTDIYETVLNEKESTLIPRQLEYECSSPQLFRSFSMHLYSLGKGGIVVVNSLLVEQLHPSSLIEKQNIFDEDHYVDQNKIVHQCANCRRIRRLGKLEQWDWVPKLTKEPHANTSHGICPPCMQHYYLI